MILIFFIILAACAQLHELAHSMLVAHNHYRLIHISPPLKLSTSLSEQAQKYALEIVDKHDGVLIASSESTRKGVGESLFMDCDPHGHIKTGEEATRKWYVGLELIICDCVFIWLYSLPTGTQRQNNVVTTSF